MTGRRVGLLAAAIVTALLAGCTAAPPPGEVPAVSTPHARVPALPLPPVPSMEVRPELLELAACVECARPDGADRDRFFSGRLALGALDALVEAPDAPSRAGQGGSLLVAGYFGGVQLRGALGSIGARDAGPAAPLLDLVGRSTLGALDDQVGRLQDLAAEGTDAQVRAASRELLPVLALLYGYNLGYLQVALDHPPDGVSVPSERIECPTTLSCRTPSLQLAGASRFDGTFGRLAAPPDPRWDDVATTVSTLVDAAVPGGRAVWSRLLVGGGFAPEGYEAIVDLSGGFLQVAGVALAGSAEAAARGDVGLSRRSLALTAGLIAWAGSYFLGLASPLPDTSLPQLHCAVTG